MVTADISNRIENGFSAFAAEFAGDSQIESLSTAHPFDSHPPLDQRLASIGVAADEPDLSRALQNSGDGRWYHNLAEAAKLEKQQWDEYEDRFRTVHEQSLCYRYLPSTDEEREIVVRHFPPVTYCCKKGELSIDTDQMSFDNWREPIAMKEIVSITIEDGILSIDRTPSAGKKRKAIGLKLGLFGKRTDTVLDTINNYYGRYKMAEAYLEQAK